MDNSVFDSLQVKYKGFTKENSSEGTLTTVIYQGSKELCSRAMDQLIVNSVSKGHGTIESVKMTQDEGPIWNLEVEYAVEAGGISKGTSYGPKQSSLTMRMMSLPLESKSNYRKHWNNNLYSTKKNAKLPEFWASATYDDDGVANSSVEYPGDGSNPSKIEYFAWAKSLNELPALPNSYIWHQIKEMTKPGVDSFDFPVYEVTESSKHTSQRAAGWAVGRRAGRISSPVNGDFGIVRRFGGNWLCEGGTVSYDGRYWVATCTYTHSPDKKGWDGDLYRDEI